MVPVPFGSASPTALRQVVRHGRIKSGSGGGDSGTARTLPSFSWLSWTKSSTFNRRLSVGRPQEIEQARAAERNARARLAQAERGLTPEEKAEAKARLDAAAAQEILARKDAARMEELYGHGAVSHQQSDLSSPSE